ncbi:phage/plasmid primase, P4 family [uncultured Roseovarius sp.]|uniref:phage/plasmid primase, P4 family n=1 Tax=uncultured Roseovarius sp. TaxID=293344 RepID=UPI0025F52E9C|nr:phage/plasmid primase, P4 family [uncultured Roseovarius sp.]
MLIDPNFKNPCLEAALTYAQLGFSVFPAKPGEKKGFKSKATSNGNSWGATNDADEIKKDWKKFPDANVGIATGQVSGIFVVDVDTVEGHGVDGIANFGVLIEQHGDWPETVCAESPSGSLHYYFRNPPGVKIKKSTSKLAEGVDVLGEGACVIAPPSIGPSGDTQYEWIVSPHETDIADPPDWLIEAIAKPISKASLRKEAPIKPDPMISAWKAAEKIKSAPEGQRNCTLNAEAFKIGKLIAKGRLEKDATLSLLSEAAKDVGLGEAEVLATVKSAFDSASKAIEHEALAAASQDDLAIALGKDSFDMNARHVAGEGKWYLWDKTRWVRDEKMRHMTLIREFLRDFGEDENAKARRRLLQATSIAAIEKLARSNEASAADPKDFDANLELLGTPEATVDLRTGQQYTPCRDDMITRQSSFSPEAGKPELFLAFLDQIFPNDPEMVDFIQRLAGYALTGHVSEHKLVFFHGAGRNGKSVLLNVLLKIMGDYARRMPASVLLGSAVERHPTDIAGLCRARLAVGSEIPDGARWDEARIKDLTGGDRISARFMRQDFFDFDPQFTLIIAGNNRPEIQSVDEAIRRRILLVPFNVTIPENEQDKQLEEKLLQQEGGKILSWIIEGAKIWFQQGLNPPACILKASTEYLAEQDEFSQFLDDETVPDPGAFVSTSDLSKRFEMWADKSGSSKMSSKAINGEMKKRGYHYQKTSAARGFSGIKLAPLYPANPQAAPCNL